ncbi:MAG: N-acetyl-gamma-glutamyl-phosphate reductase [Candidatus Omnitrophica bacterium]|jgi:N-acetyl-gamma-glutamyl-phosphate reductase|nr:N-acetyl-gamma-glutamyl-phosphate reductase [Candidatus Omnitrophota bacterium]
MKVKVAVLGATGFTGEKLVELLLNHPKVELTYLASRTPKPVPYSSLFARFAKKTELQCEPLDTKKASQVSDILFLSLPHTVSMEVAPYLLKANKKVIDLSADYRLKDTLVYKEYYKMPHKDEANLKKAVYGLAELYEAQIAKADLIANAGCYPTSVILGLYPLAKENLIEGAVFVDSKSSITGAGRKAVIDYHYSNISGNIWAYKPFVHQHTPEILAVLEEKTKQELKLSFVPHVVGVEAGIYSTMHLGLKKKLSNDNLKDIYLKYYKDCPFVRIKDNLPALKEVVGTNFCDIGFSLDSQGKIAVIASSIDNLIKGAAGNAIQNMNIMVGLDQKLGLL